MENNQITVTDLVTLKNLIDLSCTRGAFRANEMREVGEVYEKLSQFLEAVMAQAQAQANAPDGSISDQPLGE